MRSCSALRRVRSSLKWLDLRWSSASRSRKRSSWTRRSISMRVSWRMSAIRRSRSFSNLAMVFSLIARSTSLSLSRKRDVRLSLDARLQVRAGEILKNALRQAGQDKGSVVVLDPATGDLLAAVSYPLPPIGPGDAMPVEAGRTETEDAAANPYLDRARYGLYP